MYNLLIPLLLLVTPAPELMTADADTPDAATAPAPSSASIAQAPKDGDKKPLPAPAPKKPRPPKEDDASKDGGKDGKGDKDGDKDGKDGGKKNKGQLSCELITKEAPRGGRLEVKGELGKTPLIKIAGRFTRIIERRGNTIAVQIHRDSNGGAVTLKSGKQEADCGTLTIIGKN